MRRESSACVTPSVGVSYARASVSDRAVSVPVILGICSRKVKGESNGWGWRISVSMAQLQV